jgi:nicotinate-nucleotide adenylyltransferase
MEKVAVLGGTFNPVHRGHLLLAQTAQTQFQLNRVIWVPASQPPHKLPQVSSSSPLQLAAKPIDIKHRLEMVRLAIAEHSSFEVAALPLVTPGQKSSRELDQANQPDQAQFSSYAVDTLKTLQAAYLNCQWYWIIGQDAFQTLPRWRARHLLAQNCCWLVAPRPITSPSSPEQSPPSLSDQANQPDQPNWVESDLAEICAEVACQLAAEQISLQWERIAMSPIKISSSQIRQYCCEQRSIRGLVPASVERYILAHRLYR